MLHVQNTFLIIVYVWDMHSAVLYLSTAHAYNMKTCPFFTSCQTDLHQIKLLLDEKGSLQQCCMLNQRLLGRKSVDCDICFKQQFSLAG